MDVQTIINGLLATILAGVGWAARELWGAVKRLREDLQKIEVALPTNYVRKDEFADGVKEIKMMLEKISDKLDAKADK
ncbi:MAG: hypothetical protein ABFD60_15290 [Bryobacteraceae bacterium]